MIEEIKPDSTHLRQVIELGNANSAPRNLETPRESSGGYQMVEHSEVCVRCRG